MVQKGVKRVTHGWSMKTKYINGWIICNINYEMVAKMIFLNKHYNRKKASKLSCVAFY